MSRHDSWTNPRPVRRRSGLGLRTILVGASLWLGACAGTAASPAAIPVPADLPLQTYDQGYRMRYALEQSPTQVRAVGLISTSGFPAHQATLVLYGLDGGGRIVSRAYGVVRQRFDLTPQPFEVLLQPAGSEARFDLRVWEQVRPGVQGGGGR